MSLTTILRRDDDSGRDESFPSPAAAEGGRDVDDGRYFDKSQGAKRTTGQEHIFGRPALLGMWAVHYIPSLVR